MPDAHEVRFTTRCLHCGKYREEVVRSPDWWFILWRRLPLIRLLRLVHRVERGGSCPTTHRIAYWNLIRAHAVALPMGLHLPVRWVRRVWEWSFRYRPSAFERRLREQFDEGTSNALTKTIQQQDYVADGNRAAEAQFLSALSASRPPRKDVENHALAPRPPLG